ncbi:MAG: hypothetical protein AAF698_01500 [Pseudomonadota bacterium]
MTKGLRGRMRAAERNFDAAIDGLQAELGRLKAEPEDADAGRLAEQARRTQKALQTLLDIDLKRPGAGDGPAPGALDLEAARREIEDRLARLAAA